VPGNKVYRSHVDIVKDIATGELKDFIEELEVLPYDIKIEYIHGGWVFRAVTVIGDFEYSSEEVPFPITQRVFKDAILHVIELVEEQKNDS